MSLRRRLHAIETAHERHCRRMIATTAAQYGLSVDEFLAEAEAFFRLPLAEQLARVDALEAELRAEGMTMDDLDEIKETLVREYRPI